jgi:hypothetical protein
MTTPAVTTLRQTLATALQANTVYQVFSYPPATIQANSVVIIPDDPYLEPSNDSWASVGPTAHFKLLITVPLFDNQGNLQGIESAVVTMFNALFAATENDTIAYNVGTVSQPQVLSVASGDLLSCEMQISLITAWE